MEYLRSVNEQLLQDFSHEVREQFRHEFIDGLWLKLQTVVSTEIQKSAEVFCKSERG